MLKRAQFAIRKEKFKEMCVDPKKALEYLQKYVNPVVDHSNQEQVKEFSSLSFWLFGWNKVAPGLVDYNLKFKGYVPEQSTSKASAGSGENGGLLGASSGLLCS